MNLQPAPIRTPPLDERGILNRLWSRWFSDLYDKLTETINNAVGVVKKVCGKLPDVNGNVAVIYSDVGADVAGAAATVQTALTTHANKTGTQVHGLGSAATHAATEFDSAGAAAAIQTALTTHAGLTGVDVHGLGTASTQDISDFDAAGAATAITLAGLGGVPLTRHITTALDLSADRNLGASDVGADAAGTAAGAVSVHAALLTGVHGLAITAGKTLTVEDDTSLKASSVQLKNFTATLEKTGTVIVKTNVASGSVAAGWWRFAQSSSLPCNGIFKIKYYRGTTLHSMIVQVGIFDGCTTPNISILSNTLGT